ncbi:MAG: DUF1559 domain-containing protein [Gemmataceae bacterium]
MTSIVLLATVYTVAFDPVPKANPLPMISDAMWKQSDEQLKMLGIALHSYHDVYGHLPQDIVDAKGKALISWRVQLLPYLEAEELYKEFRLTEAWDSEHNRKLIEKMPKVLAPSRLKLETGHTLYQGFVGDDTVFRKGKTVNILTMADGASNTAMVATAGKSVPWTKPEDIPFDAKKDLPKLGADFDGEFAMLMADGSVKKIKRDFHHGTMKDVIQMNDGRPIVFKAIEK